MKPINHVVISFSFSAALWFFTKSLGAGIVCFLSGFLLDLDHIIEYIINYGLKNFSFRHCYDISLRTSTPNEGPRFEKLHLIFHSIEVVFLLWAITIYTKNIYIFAATLGCSLHLILDYIGNAQYFRFYFIIWRARRGFEADRVLKKVNDTE